MVIQREYNNLQGDKSVDEMNLELEQKVLECERKKLELAAEINKLDINLLEAQQNGKGKISHLNTDSGEETNQG